VNDRKPRITIRKVLGPADDAGLFDLKVDTTIVKAAAGNAGTGSLMVLPGSYTVSEEGANGTSLADDTTQLTCRKNGQPDGSAFDTSLPVTVYPGDDEVCTITNMRN
jgi:hypothetical protein